MAPDRAYRDLIALWRERALLESCATLLGWDEETYLPDGGIEARAEQQALLARLGHERATDPRVADLLGEAEHALAGGDAVMTRNLQLMRRDFDAAQRVPASLIEELARQTTRAQGAWETARDDADPGPYLPVLQRVVELTCAWADCLRDGGSRYEVCLDEWEPELTEDVVVRTLDALRAPLAALVDDAQAKQRPRARPLPAVSIERQRAISEAAAGWLGFDFSCGRLDTAAHPSTMRIGPGDVRLTTRFARELPLRGLLSTLHEVGHGLYDQNLPAEHFGAPIGDASSIVLHESQARLVENLVGRSRGFWTFALPRLAELAPVLAEVTVDDVVSTLRRVERGTNRVFADELTYDLHIAIRVDLERALLRDDLRCADLPGAWDEAYARHLTRPPDDAEGVLQDGHWAAGMFGYFPTYTLGNVVAAQLWDAAERALGDLESAMARGELAPLVAYLRDAVHRHAGLVPTRELLERATGRGLDPSALIARLAARYG
jgi:carboxypeptidase Taq